MIRDHFVYTAYDAAGRVLYVGCTKDLRSRQAAHRTQSDWYPHAARFHLRGPFTREVGREVERERLAIERPLYAFHPARRTLLAVKRRIAGREQARMLANGLDFSSAVFAAGAVAERLTGCPGNRSPVHVTDELLRQAFMAEHAHRQQAAS